MPRSARATIASHSGIASSGKAREIAIWIYNIDNEVVAAEHNSQYGKAPKTASGYLGALIRNIDLRVIVAGTDHNGFDRENPYVVHP